jgi:hypothetical protein
MIAESLLETIVDGTGWRVTNRYPPAGGRLQTYIIERSA